MRLTFIHMLLIRTAPFAKVLSLRDKIQMDEGTCDPCGPGQINMIASIVRSALWGQISMNDAIRLCGVRSTWSMRVCDPCRVR